MKKMFYIFALIFCANSFCYSQAIEVPPDSIFIQREQSPKFPGGDEELKRRRADTIALQTTPINPKSIRISCKNCKDCEPLYILDGVEITVEQLQEIDLSRVESINVLKGSDATDLYGAKAVHGVIVITTKK